ncbi:unnamed protein product [Lathyrus sativus]|nr:unnamed protein product [Lathyrus sativus]
MSKHQLLTTMFEKLRIGEDETITESFVRVRDMTNIFFALDEKMSEEKLARKILISLPRTFEMKVTTIEEVQYISSIKVDELIDLLLTFQMGISDIPRNKIKGVAFKADVVEDKKNIDSNNFKINTDKTVNDKEYVYAEKDDEDIFINNK